MEKINTPHTILIESSPNDADLAIVSIDSIGNAGRLNAYVLGQYGYSEYDLPKRHDLTHGFSQLPGNDKRKPILFVVTVDGGKTRENLDKNLYNTLVEFRGWFRSKTVWLPLMGTGDGGLSLEESYLIIVSAINRFQEDHPTETHFLFSLPNSLDGKVLLNKINNVSGNPGDILKKFIDSLRCSFFLVGSVWSGEDQVKRFYENEIWEKGYEDESYSGLINEVKKNDILIIKSTYASKSDRISYLKIKAIGRVLENVNDGATLKVEWLIKDLSVDIEHLGYFRDTVHRLNKEDASLIFEKIDINFLQILLPRKTNSHTIAGLISDSDKGVDYLNIDKDVIAFARVISAKSFDPPLAIALFGKWGSGKSFFMGKLKEQVISFSKNNPNDIYCRGIAHISFNAWSYMDTNLWASLVTKIFEGLREYISENAKQEQKEAVEKDLANQLSIAKEEINVLKSKQETINSQINHLKQRQQSLATTLNENINKIRSNTVTRVIKQIDQTFDTKDKILAALKENNSYLQTEAELKKFIPEEYLNDPHAAYEKIKTKYIFLKEFFSRDKIQSNIWWLIAILSAILFIPPILSLCISSLSTVNFLIPQAVISFLAIAGGIWKRAEGVYNKLQPTIASFWAVKENYEQQVKIAISKFEQEEKAIQLEIEKGKSEAIVINEQIQKAEIIKADLEFKITHALATEALYTFIDKRASSEDYKKHLGIISIIRKDFETLNDLFADHNEEVTKAQNAKEFKDKFNKPLERIVLYVDDLDRCPEDNVVQVLEAVNLLMAFPLFIVVVGVDGRWVKNALLKKHALQFTGKINGFELPDEELDIVEPFRYLEKIFQVPFHLKEASDENVKEMILKLANIKPALKEVLVEKTKLESKTGQNPENIHKDIKPDNIQTLTNRNSNLSASNEKTEALIINEDEILIMQDMSLIIGNNPRAIKRFINVYRIIKAHDEFYNAEPEQNVLAVVLFLLALPLGGYKKLVKSFEQFMSDDKNLIKPFALFLQSEQKNSEIDKFRKELDIILSDTQTFKVLQQTQISLFSDHYPFIKRFTF